MSNFIHLHIHSSHSLLDGFGQIEDYARTAQEYGMEYLALTDHGNVDNALNFMKACQKYDVKPIFGNEFFVVEDVTKRVKGEKRSHMVALAQNEEGWRNILKLTTLSNIEGFFHRPRIDVQMILNNYKGIIWLSGCSATPLHHEWGIKLFNELREEAEVYLEIMPHNYKEQIETNTLCSFLSTEWQLPLVATQDSHYVRKEDAICQEVMLAVQTKKQWNDPDRWRFNSDEFYFRTRREMMQAFMAQGCVERDIYMEAMRNTEVIAERIDFNKIEPKKISLPNIKGKYANDIDNLQALCEKGMEEYGFSLKVEYNNRLLEEMTLIEEKGFERYFLLVWDLVNWCRKNDIMTGPGRGSGSGSSVCYLLGITQVDPIEHGLLFFRFISPDRIDIPDLDLDFEDRKRSLIRKYLEETYGKYNVAGVSTFSVMRGKGALRDVSRVFAVPLADVNKACSVIETKLDGEEDSDKTIETALHNFEEGQSFLEKYPQVSEIAIKSEGTERNRGVHAAAIVIADEDLREGNKCSLVLGKEKELVINWDKNDIEYMGLMKLDVLGLKMLSVLNYCKELIKKNQGKDIEYDKIPLTDRRAYEEFTKGNNIGCFQVGSPGLRKFCQQIKVGDFRTLVHTTALYRPGTLHSGATDTFISRKHGTSEVPNDHPLINEITKDTYGIILYQEQLMLLVNKLAGIEWKIVDKIRKDVAKSKGVEALRKYEKMFVEGCVKNKTIREEQARTLWNDLVNFGSYSFNLSHATTYSVITYWDMYLKIYYPTEFICALLTYGTDDDDKKDEYISEAFRLGLDIRPPKIGKSKAFEWIIDHGILYCPFIEIKGVGDKTAQGFEKLDKANNKGFYKKETSPVSTRFLNILEKINAWEDKPLTDEESDNISQYLGVSLVKNKLYKYKKLIKLLNSSLKLSTVKEININEIDTEYKYYFGYIQELNLTTKNGKNGKYNIATASFKDSTGDCKISFDSTLYQNCSSEVEHCEGEIIILKASCPKKAGNMVVTEAWFQSDILSGNLDTLFLGLAESRRYKSLESQNCTACELRKECSKVSETQQGRYNMMIINETALSGEAERVLWREMRRHDFVQKDFHVSSFIKCGVKDVKKITRKNVDECSKWLEEEIENLEPFVVLSMGNTGVKFFTDEDSGIMAKNGTTEWNERYGCWVCYCNSPTTTFYGQDNMKTFKEGCENFIQKLKNLGLITF